MSDAFAVFGRRGRPFDKTTQARADSLARLRALFCFAPWLVESSHRYVGALIDYSDDGRTTLQFSATWPDLASMKADIAARDDIGCWVVADLDDDRLRFAARDVKTPTGLLAGPGIALKHLRRDQDSWDRVGAAFEAAVAAA